MKLQVKPQKLAPKEFQEKLKLMRLWPSTQRSEVGALIRHIAYLDERIEILEKEVREYKQIAFFDDKAKIVAERATPKKIAPPFHKPTKAERFYLMFTDSRDSLGAYLRLNRDITKEEMKRIANEWAKENGKELLQ